MTMDPSAFPPGVAEQLAAAHGETAASVSSVTPSVAAPKFIDGAARSTVIKLEWPVEYGGVEYKAVVLRRLTVAEVAAFIKKIAEQPDEEQVTVPVFRTPDHDAALPQAVLDGLDDDDLVRLNEAAESFLPRRFRARTTESSTPDNGGPIAP